jgi:hypothetical protein
VIRVPGADESALPRGDRPVAVPVFSEIHELLESRAADVAREIEHLKGVVFRSRIRRERRRDD